MNSTVVLSWDSPSIPFASVYHKKQASPNAVSFCANCYTTTFKTAVAEPASKIIRLNEDMTFNSYSLKNIKE